MVGFKMVGGSLKQLRLWWHLLALTWILTHLPSLCLSRSWLSHGLRVSGQKYAHWASAEGHFARLCQSSSCVFSDRAADTGPAVGLMPFHSPALLSAYNSRSPAISLCFRKKQVCDPTHVHHADGDGAVDPDWVSGAVFYYQQRQGHR